MSTFHTVEYKSSLELEVGDEIVTAFRRGTNNQQALKTEKVKTVVPFNRGCRNVHVNDKACYDMSAMVPVKVGG